MNHLRECFAVPWRNRHLLAQLTRREVAARYKGLFLGMFWSLFQPLLLMGIYYFVFGLIFKPRWPQAESNRAVFALILFLGIIMYEVIAAALIQGPGLVVNKAVFVKKVIFPLEILSWTSLGVSLFFFMEAFVLWVVMATFFGLLKPAGLYFIVPLVLCMAGYHLGLAWILSALGVFTRDIAQIMSPASACLMFLTPIFYPLDVVPQALRFVFVFNPLAFMVESARNLLIFGQAPRWDLYCLYTGLGWALALLGFIFFQRCKRTFADCM
jgi:lipopolysaccharide transport system permease protein